ncbi:TrkH family potassium uptake protein [uncultured Methanobrevibacter sp.]|uniref:TrkH family potassium uptake protein n=1 Tax=uncultured Methanobrevibacter sp. TaxID=253161 RepID=UPI002633D048
MRINHLSKQDIKIILHYLGYIMEGIGIILSVPLIIDLIYMENIYFLGLVPCICSVLIGYFLSRHFKDYTKLKLKHGMIISSVSWLWAGLIAAIIMTLILDISFLDAFFENISAWTGSGLSLINDVEALPHSILFLRSLEQWIGGLGVVIIFISIIMKPGTSGYKLYKSEARDEKIKPNIRNTMNKTLEIYLIYTFCGIILYLLAGLPLFDSINLTFTTISTGGMSIKNANIGFYNNNIIYIITMFLMILGATSFTVHYRMIKTRGKSIIKDIQFQFMIIAIIFSAIIIALISNIAPMNVIFHVISAVTTTGANIASPAELASWSAPVLTAIMLLMIMGGSSGSTVGAVKILRIITFLKSTNITVRKIVRPEGNVVKSKIGKRELNDREMSEATSYIALYLFILIVAWTILLFYTNDPVNSLFDVTSTIGNVGLSTGLINGNLSTIPKLVLILLMWMGRLEIIPILLTARLGVETVKQGFKITKKSIKRKIKYVLIRD